MFKSWLWTSPYGQTILTVLAASGVLFFILVIIGHYSNRYEERTGSESRSRKGDKPLQILVLLLLLLAGCDAGANIYIPVAGGGVASNVTECSLMSCDLNSSTTLGGQSICLSDGTNCLPASNPFNQDLNTNDQVQFDSVTVSDIYGLGGVTIQNNGATGQLFIRSDTANQLVFESLIGTYLYQFFTSEADSKLTLNYYDMNLASYVPLLIFDNASMADFPLGAGTNGSPYCTPANGLCNSTASNLTWDAAVANFYPLNSNPYPYASTAYTAAVNDSAVANATDQADALGYLNSTKAFNDTVNANLTTLKTNDTDQAGALGYLNSTKAFNSTVNTNLTALKTNDTNQAGALGYLNTTKYNSSNMLNITIQTGQPFYLNGTASVFEDIAVSLSSQGIGPSVPTYSTSNMSYVFSGTSSTESLYGSLQLPHSYREGSNIGCHLHGYPTNSTTGMNVSWNLSYAWTNYNEVRGANANIIINQSVGVVSHNHTIWNFGNVTGTGKTISSIIQFQLKRCSACAADNYTADVVVASFDCHYELDTLGSASEYGKWS